MSTLFFKSNEDGAEVVLVGEVTGIEFADAIAKTADGIAYQFDELAHAFATVTLSFEDVNGVAAMLSSILRAMDKLKRQHKAKGRGKNWRNVR